MKSLMLILIFFQINFSQNIEIIAHRGSPEKAPENTMSSFKQAVEDGATIIEIDVHQTKDGIPIIMHDGSIDRTTNGRGDVEDLTFEQIRSYSAGRWFDPEFESEKVPTLEEVLVWLPDGIKLLMEIKDDSDQGIEETVLALINKHQREDRIILKSFESDVLDTFHEINNDIPRLKIILLELGFIGLNIERGLSTGSIFDLNVDYVQIHIYGMSKRKVEKAHEAGKKIFVWGVNDEDDMLEMIELGVDGIETDFPGKLRNLLDEHDLIKN